MASAEKRVRNGRAPWYARYRTPDGQQRTRTFARKVDADHFLVEIEASKQRGSFVDPRRRPDPRSAIGLTTGWQLRPDLSPTTRNRYEGIITRHIRPRWGRVRLGDGTHAQVQRWLTGLHLAPASIKEGAPGALDGAGVRRYRDGRLAVQPRGRRKPAARPGRPNKRFLRPSAGFTN